MTRCAAVFLILNSLLGVQMIGGQTVQLDRIAVLESPSDTVNWGRTNPEIVALGDSRWLVSNLLEDWKWAELDWDGRLIRSAGAPWDGGAPGQYRDINLVLPVAGDTILVFERGRIVRALRDGTYVGSWISPISAQSWTWHQGKLWVSGALRPEVGEAGGREVLLGFDPAGHLVDSIPIRGGASSTHLVARWKGDLWAVEYGTERFKRLDPDGAEVEEVWEPFGYDVGRIYGVVGTAEGQLIVFRKPDGKPTLELVVFDEDRREVSRRVFGSEEEPRLLMLTPQGFGITARMDAETGLTSYEVHRIEVVEEG